MFRRTARRVQGEVHVGFALEGSVQLLQQLTRLQGEPSPKRPRLASGWNDTHGLHDITTDPPIDPSKGQPGSSVADTNNPEQNSSPKMNSSAENANTVRDLPDASMDNNPKKRKKKKRKNQKKMETVLLSGPSQGQSHASQEKTSNETSSENESSTDEMSHLHTEGSTQVESKDTSSSETAKLTPDAGKQSKKRNVPNGNDKDATAAQALDENGNMETQAKQKKLQETKSNDKTQKQTNQMQTTASDKNDQKTKDGDEVPTVEQVKGGHAETQQSESMGDSKAEAKESEDSQEPEFEPPTIRRSCNTEMPRNKRITIHFHAILSNDFKFNVDDDRIFVRAGRIIGRWGENIAELVVTRGLGEHGLLVEGSMEAKREETVSESIPYKYVIYKHKNKKKEKYQFEYIYKLESSSQPTNRSLFVKPHLLTDDGDWHQYDDIICVEPTKNMFQRLKDRVWSEQKKSVVDGRNIAGDVMLHRIFDLLTNWSAQNVKSFMKQLRQFFQVYGNPYIYEDKNKRWTSLQYGEDDVRNLMKEFLLLNVTPQMLKDREGTSSYVRDPLKAALVFLYVGMTYRIKLLQPEFDSLCTLLCLPPLPKDKFPQYWANLSQDIAELGDVPSMLMRLMSKTRSLTWTLALPLLHLAQGGTIPFEVQLPSNLKYGKVWAGLSDFAVDAPLSDYDAKILWGKFQQHAHLFDVDPLTVRSCLYLLSLQCLQRHSEMFSVELLDMLLAFSGKVPTEIGYQNYEVVSDLLVHIQGKIIEGKYSFPTELYRNHCLEMLVALLEKLCNGLTSLKSFPDIPLSCMNLMASVTRVECAKQQESAKEAQTKITMVSQAVDVLGRWLSSRYKKPLLSRSFNRKVEASKEIELWNDVISINFKDEVSTAEWRQKFTMDFEAKYKKASCLDQIEYYCAEFEGLERSYPFIAASVEACALEAVSSLCQSKSEAKLFEKFKIDGKFGKLISAIIQKSWPLDRHGMYEDDEEVVFEHLLSWTVAKDIFRLHGAKEHLSERLTQDANERLTKAISVFTAVTRQLIDGSIKIRLLNMVLRSRMIFTNLLRTDCLSKHQKDKDNARMRALLDSRQKEVDSVYHEKKLYDVLLTTIQKLEEHIQVDPQIMETNKRLNLEEHPLNSFMDVHRNEDPDAPGAGIVAYFNLPQEVREMSLALCRFEESHIFQRFWKHHVLRLNSDDVVDIETICRDIFLPCMADYKATYEALKNGTIRLEMVNKLFKHFNDKYEDLANDLGIMCRVDDAADRGWIQERVEQIKQSHQLHLAVASAKFIKSVKQTLCLHGDFTVLDILLKVETAEFYKEPLRRIDNDLIQAKRIVMEIDVPRKKCLQELGKRKLFVNWVKDSLEDINELKVFVDLASISAGENPMDVDRVACFHDAVLGYSSMLFELKPDCGFDVFKETLKKLWRALDNDSNLPKKLRDSARHLEWLKTVKESHGSVELSSLSLASTINSKGIYMISARGVKTLSLGTALKLQIQEGMGGEERMRYYSLEDLRELQNKLMLMSGKADQGQNEVERFVEVFSSVQRLAEAFIALCDAGNPLFRLWEAQIKCSLSCTEPITMDFNLETSRGAVVVLGSLEVRLPELCKKIETCLIYWNDFVNKQRSQHYYLNYFTAEQIVYLCSQLSQQKVTAIDEQVLMMLSFIKPNCDPSDLRKVWHELQYGFLTKPEERSKDIHFQTFAVSPGDADDCRFDDESPRLGHSFEAFDQIWNAYMTDMKMFLPNTLDMKTLGQLLKLLSVEGVGDTTKRELPQGFKIGTPNLIVCPPEDVLASCISIYMSSNQENLPTYDEVLLCNSSTQYEEVELFLRRCLGEGDRGQKIYSLLYGDLLTYEVSSKMEVFFHRMKKQSRKDYRLVLICSSERGSLPSAFSQYKLPVVTQEPLACIQRYLHAHYVVPAEQLSAAAAFKDRLCVGVVSSRRAGVGKSLYVKRIFEKLQEISPEPPVMKCVRMTQPNVDENLVLQTLMNTPNSSQLAVFHIDVTSSVQKGIHEFLFKLLILRYLMDSKGRMWKCNEKQLYVIEFLEPTLKSNKNASMQNQLAGSSFLSVFPKVFCQPPKEVLMLEMTKRERPNDAPSEDPLMDDKAFRSEAFQRPYQYLIRFNQRHNLDGFTSKGVEGSHVECLQMLLMYCGILDPSWAELRNFAWFLNLQLKDCETSDFCNSELTGDILAGFKNFVVDFMILMAKDFATPSLSISDQSSGRPEFDANLREEDLAPFLIRKRWETEPHPYIFFNSDHTSMTFIGFHLQPNAAGLVDAIDPVGGRVIRSNIMTKALYDGLRLQRVPFNMDFDRLNRAEKVEWLCNVLGIQWPLDPDETYELTTDNVLKMLAIHMRFRCGIPVVIMGETGCGKTRLIKFLCELQRSGVAAESMKLVKVHGGTTSDVIYSKVREAENIAAVNKLDYGFRSVLFFDEANTTEDISSIKEVLCDRTIKGDSLTPDCGLEIIAACNPYRKHTDEMIERLESAGLGYKVRAEETDEKLGSIPLRQLVYRVHALPPSMVPLVWDFGQLNDQTEKIYIHQIVKRVVESKGIDQSCIKWITEVLSASQRYMRTRKDECSFVSLRDVERCMKAFTWFYDKHGMFFEELGALERSEDHEGDREQLEDIDPVLWSLIIAVGVCYHACLEKKDDYRKVVSACLQGFSAARISQEISLMQDLLLSGVPMGETIAKNCALKENVFMMVICIELRIPLFLVGKPGSSKSLSKTLVADAMQGQASHSDLYKELKQIHLVSFQCSPHSTPEGIINTFKQCGRFQEGKNLDEYISVVVLDEIGLAEDSPKMPLKTLHPLLEEGCIDDEPLPHKKVGFIGISNWALDPAKMNRGIFVSRADPDEKELIESAKGICSSDIMVLEKVQDFFHPFAKAYLKVCHEQGKGFFGLRDYYSLIKMIFGVAKAAQRKPNAEEIVKAVLRNFSGRDDVDAVSIFTETLHLAFNVDDISAIEFVRENLQAVGQEEECRYLLMLTKNYAALKILQQTFFLERCQPEIIFGSSFPKDQEYTQICRNINRVKICMETGQTVVLLNLQNLYESLYDALNQYYVYLGGQKYVDLGLGTHRVKCRVHKDFRLILIEERHTVYKEFPIPLINRLEKHYLDIHTVLKPEQKRVVQELEEWVRRFVSVGSGPAPASKPKFRPPDVFIGYHSDTCASVVLQVVELIRDNAAERDTEQTVLEEAKLILLRCATPDSVVRLDCSELPKMESQHLSKVYFEEQRNSCLAEFIELTTKETFSFSFVLEVTTFSRLLTESEVAIMEQMSHKIELFSLQQFDTEQSFLKKIRNFLTATNEDDAAGRRNKILIIQCDFDEATHSSNLIASTKYSAMNEINKITHEGMGFAVLVYFITRLPRIEGGTSYVGFHGGPWRSVHIDDLRSPKDIVPNINSLKNMTISQMFGESMNQPEAMEVDDIYSENEREEQSGGSNPPDFALDTTALVRSCVQSAVTMLRDQMDDGRGSTRRLVTLLTLLSDDDELKGEFLQTLKKHLHSLLATRDGTFTSAQNNWVIKEASNIDALQEGGTFRHTLWKRIQAVVAPVIAQLVSVIDRDRNLDLLLDKGCSGAVKRLWLDIFADEEFLKLAQLTPDSRSKGTFIVQNSISQDLSVCCCMPFSGRIKDSLEELWVHARYNEGHSQQEFDEMFSTTPLGRYIAKADPEMQGEFFQRYLEDFVFMTMKVTSADEQRILCHALNSCVNELRTKLAVTDKVLSLAWVNAAYQEFKNRLQNFSRIICLEPQVTQDLLSNPYCKNEAELILDVYAAFACVEYLEPNALDTEAKRQAWLTQVKKLKVPIELIFSKESVRSYGEKSEAIAFQVKARWSRIFSLSLFVEHMFEDITEKLAPLILETTSQLGEVLTANSDLKTQQPFEAVIMQLKNCKDKAVEHIFKFGIVVCPVCLVDPVDPVVLPCQHIYCLACIKDWLIPGQMYCPYCRQEVEDFALDTSDDVRAAIAQHAHFRKLCNAFFIDLVSTVCFKDNSPPCREVILHLLSFLTVEANRNIFGGDRQILTKVLSPFDDSVDKSPVIRSVVLKLLLKYSFQEVEFYLQQHLEAVERSFALGEQDKVELYILYLNCLEDSMFERLQFRSEAELQACLQDEAAFLTQQRSLEPRVRTVTIDYLQQVARVRLDLDMAAALIVEQLRSPDGRTADARKNAFLVSVEGMCTQHGNSWYSIYLIRKICSQHGMECVRKLVNAENMRWLFPEKALPQDDTTTMIDPYLVCGEDYQAIRDTVGGVILGSSVDALQKICEDCKDSPQRATVYLLLALYREVTALYRVPDSSFHPSEEAVQALVGFIQTSKILDGHNVKSFAQALVSNQLGVLSVSPEMSENQSVLVELVVHMAAVLLCVNEEIVSPLKQLALAPSTMQAAFLPTMPEDLLAMAQQALTENLQWYYCKNGHPCTVGECQRPYQTSHCPDCGVPVGGQHHVPVAGFRPVQLQGDRTQSGHILGDPSRRDNPDMRDSESLSPVPFTIIRMMTHLAMMFGYSNQPQAIAAMIKPAVPEPGPFLLTHLEKDMGLLVKCLGKGADDTVTTAHLLISGLLPGNEEQRGNSWFSWFQRRPDEAKKNGVDKMLSTKETRNMWEIEISKSIISPMLKQLDRKLIEVNGVMRADTRVSANSVLELVYGDPATFLDPSPLNPLIHNSSVWSCREKVSVASLVHIVDQNDGKDNLPVLWRFLHKEAELRLVQHLPDILMLQRDLVKKFQNQNELSFETIADFLQSQTVSLKAWFEKRINMFLTTWNRLRVSLSTDGELKIPVELCMKDLDLNSDLKVLLPRRQGAGLCSTALVSYLIALHNDMVHCVDKHSGEETTYKVSPADLADLHVISYELERDLMPLILSNTQYSIEKGQALLEYDLPKIQKQVVSHFIQGKPVITLNGIPTLVSRQERNYEIILKDVKTKVAQEPLQPHTAFAVTGGLHSYSEVCEALTTLEVALGFLAMTGGDPHMKLTAYLEEVLQMGNQIDAHILKALKMCSLKHCVALWQLLASLKSENLLRLKRDPFGGLSKEYKVALSEEAQRQLSGFFSKVSADYFQRELHDLLVLMLMNGNPLDVKPDWRLQDALVPYIERKGMDVPPEMEEHFPEAILVSHCVEAWKFTIAFKQEHNQRS
ncbi:E3 ubiquitin-protein ligase rnf213-alpha-like [Neosynchiropus ocellatus]